MAILVITVNKECCRCKEKLDKILNHLRCKYCIEKIEYEGEKVIVRGSFCAEQLRKCIWRKAGCKIIVNILIVEVWPPVVVTPPPPVVNVNVKADVTASATAAAEAAAKAAVDVIIKNCKPPPPPPCNKPPAECSKPKPECKPVPCPYPVPYYYPMPWCCPDQPPPPCKCGGGCPGGECGGGGKTKTPCCSPPRCPKPQCPEQHVCPPPCQQQQHFCPRPYGCGCVICNRNNVNVMLVDQDDVGPCSIM